MLRPERNAMQDATYTEDGLRDETTDRLRGNRVLLIGIDLHLEPDWAALRERFPDGRVLNLTQSSELEDANAETVPRSGMAALRRVWGHHWDGVIAVQRYRKLLLLLSLVPASRHLVHEDGRLQSFSPRRIWLENAGLYATRLVPRADSFNAPRLPKPLGLANDYRFMARPRPSQARTRSEPISVSVVVSRVLKRSEVSGFLRRIERLDYPRTHLEVRMWMRPGPGDADLHLSTAIPLHVEELAAHSSMDERASLTKSAAESSVGEVLLFVDPELPTPPDLVRVHVSRHAVSDEPLVVLAPGHRRDRRLFEDPEPYRQAHLRCTSMKKTLALAAGGVSFDPDEPDQVFDFAYRLFRRGAYFMDDRRLPMVGRLERCESRPLPPRVSVYIPAYNAGATLARAIESALAQTLTDIEVCICDDGSTDETSSVLQSYQHNPRVRWTRQENAGIAEASRKAVDLCRGEFILQLDADDELYSDAAQALLDEITKDPTCSLVYGGTERVDPNLLIYNEVSSFWTPRHYSPMRSLRNCIVSHPRMFRSRDYYRTSGFDRRLKNAVDYDMYLKLSERGNVRIVNRPLYRYYIHGNNTSYKDRQTQFRNHIIVVQMALSRRNLDWVIRKPNPNEPRTLHFKPKPFAWRNRMANLLDRVGLTEQADRLVEPDPQLSRSRV